MKTRNSLLMAVFFTFVLGFVSAPALAKKGADANHKSWELFMTSAFSIPEPEKKKLDYKSWELFMTSVNSTPRMEGIDYRALETVTKNMETATKKEDFSPEAYRAWKLFMTSVHSAPKPTREKLDYKAWELFMTSVHSAPNPESVK